ncbi:lysozyme [Streptomyces beijiangensis]|uniref:lysozyme n=1 Tax=Streptomyces beijiangensis TaxID=163361 RepID=A0A939FAY3_9ACTN|nr:lysozyme [Streptomyces beijiangensis]MBO0514748.1 lysozyme [Streptomyces beijiangensis]
MARDSKPFHRRARVQILTVSVAALTALGGTALAGVPASGASEPRGHDVSSHQKNVDWSKAKAKGARFVYVKATESTTYRSPYFSQQYNGARSAGIVRGAYHFAVPTKASGNGRAQAAYFVRYGGWWRGDGWTLPPAVDLEHNPYGKNICYGLSPARMVGWIKSFSDEVQRKTGRRPVIYTTARWWNSCTGKSRAFASNHALWLARYNTTPGELPAGWSYWTIWQYDNGSGSLPGDQNLFNGSISRLTRFARG